jgi:hypothetical protein
MSEHVWRGPPEKLEPIREYLRRGDHPDGKDGYVVTDLDLVVRTFGRNYGLDAKGKFRLMEIKYGSACVETAQFRTFGLADELLRAGDPEGRYEGVYTVHHRIPEMARHSDDCECRCNRPIPEVHDEDEITVMNQPMKATEFFEWTTGNGPDIEPWKLQS